MLEHYLRMFGKLRTDKGRDRCPEITCHRAPHKPFMLLSIIDLIAQGRITQNLIEPSHELVDTFNTYWVSIMPPGSTNSKAYLFPHVRYPLGKSSGTLLTRLTVIAEPLLLGGKSERAAPAIDFANFR